MDHYLPIEVIFNLLCVCRRIGKISIPTIRRSMYTRGLFYGTYDTLPDFRFWIRLCQSANLLDNVGVFRPTIFVPDWLALSNKDQLASLVDAWQFMPSDPYQQNVRKQLLETLLLSSELGPTYDRELKGLQSLGICDDELLTPLGAHLLSGEFIEDESEEKAPWVIVGDELQIPYPPNWRLIWELEKYLEPVDPGIYSLDSQSLRRASQQAKNFQHEFEQVLEKGLQNRLPIAIIRAVESQPVIKVFPGVLLEFSATEELLTLRENRSLRKKLSNIISPHHVHLDPWQASGILTQLKKRGLVADKDFEFLNAPEAIGQNQFNQNEKAYLLALILICEGLAISMGPPPGLVGKITTGLPVKLRAAAARKSADCLNEVKPPTAWLPEDELPPIPEAHVFRRLEEAIRKQEPIDILYRKTDRYQAEPRHLTPLVIEQRGLRFYLIAYCHTRRANRTFRMDRLQLMEGPP